MKDTIRLSDKIEQGVLPDQCKIIQGPHGGRSKGLGKYLTSSQYLTNFGLHLLAVHFFFG